MTPERWRQVSQLYQAALARSEAERDRFVREACADDEWLRREVASLLAQPDSALRLLSAIDRAEPALSPGTSVGPYTILALIGEGGMGLVYRARDSRLDRIVAIKVLPPDFAHDPGRRQRFEREARAIASLTHPHICTLYEFDRAPTPDGGEIDFLVMEHLEGETLGARLRRAAQGSRLTAQSPQPIAHSPQPGPDPQGLAFPEALTIAIQVAEALAAAHKQGIVHRDLKPGNIMLTTSAAARPGTVHVKLLDFGVARLRAASLASTGPAGATESAPLGSHRSIGLTGARSAGLTGAGTIVGTLPYMAPEQLEGQDTDARTDLFGLGAIVYEMVTGRKAFEGTSPASLISAILTTDPPPLTEHAPLTPASLERVVRKCLAKDPNERWDSAHDLADELRWILEDSGAEARSAAGPDARLHEPPAKPSRAPRRVLSTVAAAAAVALVGAGWWLLADRAGELPPMRTIPLTSHPGVERGPALSPDGEQVAFTWRGPSGGDWLHLYVKLVDGGEPLLVHAGEGDVFTPAWSPDGSEIAFFRRIESETPEPGDGLFVVPALGGAARQLGAFRSGRHGLSWSPDGTRLALPHRETAETPSAIYLFELGTGEHRRLTEPPPDLIQGDSTPRFSPDGRMLAFMRVRMTSQEEIYVVPVGGGDPRRVTFTQSNLRGFDWMPDGASLVFSALLPGRPTRSGLWRVPVAGGSPTALATGEVAQSPSVSRRGDRLAYEHVVERWSIWRTQGPAPEATERLSRPLIASRAVDYFPAYSPDGLQIAFTSTRSGHSEIWIASSEGTNPRQLTTLRGYSMGAKWSPDGRQIVFISSGADDYDIFVVTAAGGVPRRLTTEATNEVSPTWSLDGRWIYFRSDRSGRLEIWKMPAEGGEATQVTRAGGSVGAESPDGRFFYFTKSTDSGGPSGLWRMPTAGGPEERVFRHPKFYMWALSAAGICYLNDEAPRPTIECGSFDGRQVTEVARFDGRRPGLGLSVSPDGKWLLYCQYEAESDLMTVENFR